MTPHGEQLNDGRRAHVHRHQATPFFSPMAFRSAYITFHSRLIPAVLRPKLPRFVGTFVPPRSLESCTDEKLEIPSAHLPPCFSARLRSRHGSLASQLLLPHAAQMHL